MKYFDVNSSNQLANYIELVIREKIDFDKFEIIEPSYPFAENWSQLFNILLEKN